MKDSLIEWTHHSFNPWIGCSKVSPGCQHCYAEKLMAARYGRVTWGAHGTRSRTGKDYWKQPLKWNEDCAKAGIRQRVFCASLADVFEEYEGTDPKGNPVSLSEWRDDLFQLIYQCRNLDWLLLTKRAESAHFFLSELQRQYGEVWGNIWLGFSAESQEWFDKRWPLIRDTPAFVRFCSYEPALAPLWLAADAAGNLHWMICGGESGPGARPMPEAWPRSMRDQCAAADVAYFFKQWGGTNKKAAGRELDGRTWDELPDKSHYAQQFGTSVAAHISNLIEAERGSNGGGSWPATLQASGPTRSATAQGCNAELSDRSAKNQ